MKLLFLDIESSARVNLTKEGLDRYVNCPHLKLLMTGYAIDDGPVHVSETVGPKLRDALYSPEYLKLAFNAPFEMLVLGKVLGRPMDPRQWFCIMAFARQLSFKGGLGEVGEHVGIPHDKRKQLDGKRLIELFCRDMGYDKRSHSDDWARFRAYNAQDVEAEREIFKRLRNVVPMNPTERKIWILDRKINERGLPIDLDHVHNAVALQQEAHRVDSLKLQMLTGVDNPNSPAQLVRWIKEKMPKANIGGLTKQVVEHLLRRPDTPPIVRNALELRQTLARSSPKKFNAFAERTGPGNRLREAYGYYGATRTGRWTGGNGVQPHNMPGGIKEQAAAEAAVEAVASRSIEWVESLYPSAAEVLVKTIRPAICAEPGHHFVVADFSSVETAVIAWLANARDLLKTLRAGQDPYKDFASTVYATPYERVSDKQRTWAKPVILGAGFGLGGVGLQRYAEVFGVKLDEHESAELIRQYRTKYMEIPNWWRMLEAAARDALANPGIICAAKSVTFVKRDDFLFMQLPSGRELAYFRPMLRDGNICYEGEHQKTRQWGLIETYGGKLAENATQAVARDLLGEGMLNADSEGFTLVGHTHDEVISHERVDSTKHTLPRLIEVITRLPDWADGLPLRAAGWTGKRYLKA